MSLGAVEFRIAGQWYVVGLPGPGLGWESVLGEAIRRHYLALDEVQARWVRVVSHRQLHRVGKVAVHLVVTSREDELMVTVRSR